MASDSNPDFMRLSLRDPIGFEERDSGIGAFDFEALRAVAGVCCAEVVEDGRCEEEREMFGFVPACAVLLAEGGCVEESSEAVV